MAILPRLLAASLAIFAGACIPLTGQYERHVEQTFAVAPGSLVAVNISGGSVHVSVSPDHTAHLNLREEIAANSGDDAERVLQAYDVELNQAGDTVFLSATRKPGVAERFGWSHRARFSATLDVPSDVRLDLRTSGGSVDVRGDRQATLRARTSGGSVKADGGAGELVLNTSGGSISVGRALNALDAKTSGGSIRIGYVGAQARAVSLATSGGSIHTGVDPSASLELAADTSGGGVRVEDLPLISQSGGRSHFKGTLNGGAGRLYAHTSGGSIVIGAATDALGALAAQR